MREVILKSHCQPGLLATEDCIQPLWWPQSQSVTTWKTKHSQRKVYLAAAAHMSWLLAIESPARLPGGRFLSLSFFNNCTALPHGGAFFTHCEAQLSGGLLHMSCGSAGSRLGGKLQIKCGLSQGRGCSLCVCSPWLASSGC